MRLLTIGRIVLPENEQKLLEKGDERVKIMYRQINDFILSDHGTGSSVQGQVNKISVLL